MHNYKQTMSHTPTHTHTLVVAHTLSDSVRTPKCGAVQCGIQQ